MMYLMTSSKNFCTPQKSVSAALQRKNLLVLHFFSNIIYENILYQYSNQTLHLEHANSPSTYGLIVLSVLRLMQHNPCHYKYMQSIGVLLYYRSKQKVRLFILCALWSPLCNRIYEGTEKILCSRLVVISMFHIHILSFLWSPLS